MQTISSPAGHALVTGACSGIGAAIARDGIDGNERGAVVVVPGWRYRLLHAVGRHLPDRLRRRLMARNSRRFRPLDRAADVAAGSGSLAPARNGAPTSA